MANHIRVHYAAQNFGIGAAPGTQQEILTAREPGAYQEQQDGHKSHAITAQRGKKTEQRFQLLIGSELRERQWHRLTALDTEFDESAGLYPVPANVSQAPALHGRT
jgi:hypothetical protein